jgi:hypothetical protein
LLASTGECTAEHIAAARMVLLATKLCAIQITLDDIRGAFDWRFLLFQKGSQAQCRFLTDSVEELAS